MHLSKRDCIETTDFGVQAKLNRSEDQEAEIRRRVDFLRWFDLTGRTI
jgi:hypothetical protein